MSASLKCPDDNEGSIEFVHQQESGNRVRTKVIYRHGEVVEVALGFAEPQTCDFKDVWSATSEPAAVNKFAWDKIVFQAAELNRKVCQVPAVNKDWQRRSEMCKSKFD